jgi:DNA polymerase III delta prime subunit
MNSAPEDIFLTPSQQSVLESAVKLIHHYNMIVIRGDSGSGKHTVANQIFKQLNAVVIPFDLCDLAQSISTTLSNQHIVDYLERLLDRAQKYMPKPISKTSSSSTINTYPKRLRSSIEDSCPIEDLQSLSLDDEFRSYQLGIIYLRNYNRVADVLSDCYAKSRYLLPLILRKFTEKLPPTIKIVVTTSVCTISEYLHWCLELSTTKDDMRSILNYYRDQGRISTSDLDTILTLSKIIPVGRIIHCLKYAFAMRDSNSALDDDDLPSVIEDYRKVLARFSGSSVDVERDVPKPILEDDLVGVEDIIDEITTSIINPMNLGISGIPIKKGLLLCGPPGTGKTSIGRWLAHQIKGKFYLIGGEAGINGSSLIDCFEMNVRRARDNAPAVIFIDDCDVLFEQPDTYRAFLTILDGIETNKRSDICVIVTCMNLRNVPSSLLRGGRLEMVLITKLPDSSKIQIILEKSLTKMVSNLKSYDDRLSGLIADDISFDLVRQLSTKMCGWNCADIHRCVNDVSRLIIANKGINLLELFERSIKQIREQYTLCGRCESTNLDDRTHDSYIS